jgi:hypothetical protein
MSDDIEDPVPEVIALRRFHLHSLWRVLLWGASAAMAVAIVAGTAFSEIGADRLKQAVASIIESAKSQPQPDINPQQLAELEKQTHDLTQTVHDLTAERDRIKSRVASLEHSLDDITGTIKRQTAQLVAQKPPQEPQKQAKDIPPPTVNAPATITTTAAPSAAAPSGDAPTTTASTTEAAPAVAGQVRLPPSRIASAAPTAMAKPDIVTEPPAQTTREIGIDVGGAASMDALRAHWAALKANVGPDLVGLRPALTTRQKLSGATDYRLVLGPLPNSATAIRLCTKFTAAHIYCRAGTFSVQQFAER